MKVRFSVKHFLWVLVVGLLLTNAFQFVTYQKMEKKLNEVAEHYARRAVGNLLEVRDALHAIPLPVTPEANAKIESAAEKLFWVRTSFEVVFDIYPADPAVQWTILSGTHTVRGELETMVKTGDYSQFEGSRDFIDSLAAAFTTPVMDPEFLNKFQQELKNVPLN